MFTKRVFLHVLLLDLVLLAQHLMRHDIGVNTLTPVVYLCLLSGVYQLRRRCRRPNEMVLRIDGKERLRRWVR